MTRPIGNATARHWPWAARAYAVSAALAFAASLACGVWLYISLGAPTTTSPAAPTAAATATSTAASTSTSTAASTPAIAGAPGEPGGMTPIWRALIINVLLFGLFAAHHSLLARSGAKIVLTRWLSPALERSTYVWVASLLFALVSLAWQPLPGVAWHIDGWLAWPPGAIQLGGVLLTLRAAAAIDPRELAGLRQAWRYGTPDGASPGVMDEAPVAFTVRGAYGLVRHPIYLGWFMMVWPSPHMTWGRVAFAAISSAYLLVAIPWEERSLEAQHGDGYRRYRAQVRWRVLPGLY